MSEETVVSPEETPSEISSKEMSVSPQKHPLFVKWSVILGIAILLNLFLVYATQVVYPAPEYQNFCRQEQTKQALATEESCVANGGQWNISDSGVPVPEGQTMAPGYCYADFTCNKEFESKNSFYQRNVFIAFVAIGFLLIVGTSFLVGVEVLSAGLSFGGVLTLVVGSLAYWSNMNDFLRVGVLGIALLALIFLAWKKFRD